MTSLASLPVAILVVAATLTATGVEARAGAAAADPLVGTWTRDSGPAIDVTQLSPGVFIGKTLNSGAVGPCPYLVGLTKWELSKQPGGKYAGTNHGFRWDSSDPATCRDFPIDVTATLGTISAGRLSMSVCYSATELTAAECNTWTKPATATPPAIVPIGTVSNGCGGGNWRILVKAQNFLGNTSRYWNSRDGYLYDPTAKVFPVSFVDACNLHDAGYAGAIVRDKLRGGIKDFRGWSRLQVDRKFLADMRLLCQRAIPKSAVYALRNCRGNGGNVSVGAASRYDFVRKVGSSFFDADLELAGTQSTGRRTNN